MKILIISRVPIRVIFQNSVTYVYIYIYIYIYMDSCVSSLVYGNMSLLLHPVIKA